MRRGSIERGVGCAAILPAALIGLAGLADGVGPKGWRGFAEFFGWATVCLGVSLLIALMLGRVRRWSYANFVVVPVAIGTVVGFTILSHWLGLHAPTAAKRAFTSALQIVGTVAPGALVIWIVSIAWSARQRD